jgi:Kef-type K+ transport system membrane component KefB
MSFFHKLRLGAILGYLTAGAILGPWGFAIIFATDEISSLAEFGVIFLLFILGIELNPKKLWQMRKLVIGLGFSQLLLTAMVIYLFCLLFNLSPQTSLIIAFGLSLSSIPANKQQTSNRESSIKDIKSGITCANITPSKHRNKC